MVICRALLCRKPLNVNCRQVRPLGSAAGEVGDYHVDEAVGELEGGRGSADATEYLVWHALGSDEPAHPPHEVPNIPLLGRAKVSHS